MSASDLSPYRAIFANATDGIALINPNGRYIEQNLAHRAILGYSDEDLIGQTPAIHVGEAVFQRIARELIDTGRFQGEVRSRRKDGRWIDIALSAFGIYDDRGEVLCYVGMKRDITGHKHAEDALRTAHDTFRHLVEQSPFGVYAIDADFRLVQVSAGAQKVFQNVRPLLGRDFAEVLRQIWPEPFASEAIGRFRHTLETGEPYRSPKTVERRRDIGEVESYDWKIERVKLPDGRWGVVCHFYDLSERQRYEDALRQSEERYRHIFESAGVSLFEEDWSEIQRWFDDLRSEGVTDLAGYLDANPEKVAASIPMIRVTDANEYAVRLFQAPSKTALLGTLGRVFTPETTAVFREELIAFWKGLDLLEQPSRLRTLKGEPLSVLCSVKVPRHRADWDRVLVAVTDVTALREAERAVRENEERFRTLADNMSQFAWMADEKGRIFWYNRRWFEYTGTTLEDMQGWGGEKVHHPDHLHRVIKKWRHALETGHVWEDTFPLRGQDGNYRWFLSRAVPIRDTDGRILRWFGTNTDVTDLREAEQAQAHLAAIVTSSDDAIISTDLNGIITSWNRGADRLYGYTEQEAVGRPIVFLMPSERMDEEPEILSRIRKGASVEHYETTRRCKDGTLLDISLTVSPIKDEEGRIIGASKVARDISERKRQEEELRRWKDELEVRVRERTSELLATQGRLMTMTSQLSLTEQRERRKLARDLHDYLAQLLAVGQMKTGMLKKQLPHNSTNTALLLDLDKVFQQALVYTRTLIAELSPPSLEDAGLPAALKWLAERFEKDGLRVDVQADGASLPLAEEQAVVVFQAVRELLFNVMKHAGVGGATVTVTLNEDGFLRVAVADRGKGFSSDALQRSAQPGHLGLVSVRERFRAMGGRVDVESLPGRGTTVTLCLPLGESVKGKASGVMGASERTVAEDRTIGSNPSIASRLTPGASRIRVLLVDDHKLVRQGLRDLLAADERIRVVGEAGTCEEALMLAANVAPDVVVTDINLPGVSGIETTRRFKALHPHMTVIGLSAHTEEHLKQDLLASGAETLLSKEYAADELIPTIIQYHDRQVAGR